MTRFDVVALVWAVLLCLALGGAIPGLVVVVMFPGLLGLAVFVLGFLKGMLGAISAEYRNRR